MVIWRGFDNCSLLETSKLVTNTICKVVLRESNICI